MGGSALRYLTVADLPPPAERELLFRERIWSGLAGLTAGAGGLVIGGWLWLTHDTDLVLDVIFWAGALVLALIALVGRAVLARALRRSNWLCRLGPGGAYLHLRSYLNATADDDGDQTVLWLPWDAVAWARAVKHRRTRWRPGIGEEHDVKEIEWVRFLDVRLRHEEAAEDLRARLDRERARIHRVKSARAQFHHWPIQALDDGAFRVAFKSRYDHVAPSLDVAASIAAQHVRLVWVRKDERAILGMAPQAREERIREHARRGEAMEAIQLARIAFGYDLGEAKTYVEKLEEGPS